MPIGPARMPLLEHLGELRMRLVRIVAFLGVAVCIFYFAAPALGRFLLEPLPVTADDLVHLGALDPFAVRFKVAFWASLVATSPVIIWQLLAFFLPALKPSERKWFTPTFIVMVVLFITGVVFCYFVILPPAFTWLLDQADGLGAILPEAAKYIDIVIKFELGFGLAFELPMVIFYLVIFDIVPYKKLRGSWRVVYVALLVFCAMITPDASPITMLLMFSAMIGLYELSLFLARIVLSRRIKKQNEELALEELE